MSSQRAEVDSRIDCAISEKEAYALDWVDRNLQRLGSRLPGIFDVGIDLMPGFIDEIVGFVRDPEMDDAAKERILARLFTEASKRINISKQVRLAYCLLGFGDGTFVSGPLPHPLTFSAVARFLVESLLPGLRETYLTEWRPHHNEALTRLLGYPHLPAPEARLLCESILGGHWDGVAATEVASRAALANLHCPVALLEQYAMSIRYPYLREFAVANPDCPDHARVAAALLRD